MSKLNFLSRFKPGTFPVDKVHPLIDAALDDDDPFVRIAVAMHPNATKENLDKALEDEYIIVRAAAAKHPTATKEHLDKALDSKQHKYVRAAAINNPRYNEYYPNGH